MPPKSEKQAPLYDEQAEASIVASIIFDQSWLNKIDLDAEDFSNENYQKLFQATLVLNQRGDQVNATSLAKETAATVESWVIPHILVESPDKIDCKHYSIIVRNLSKRRKLIVILEKIKTEMSTGSKDPQDIADKLKAELEAIGFSSKASRYPKFSNKRTYESQPPTYVFHVSSADGDRSGDIRLASTELDSPTKLKRKIREIIERNPILPKDFSGFVDFLIKTSKKVETPKETFFDETVYSAIRDWHKTADDAEVADDLNRNGYFRKANVVWFKPETVRKYLADKAKITISSQALWPILEPKGGYHYKLHSIGGAKVRLWGLPASFFEEEEEEPVEGEQLPMDEKKEDMGWLEGIN